MSNDADDVLDHAVSPLCIDHIVHRYLGERGFSDVASLLAERLGGVPAASAVPAKEFLFLKECDSAMKRQKAHQPANCSLLLQYIVSSHFTQWTREEAKQLYMKRVGASTIGCQLLENIHEFLHVLERSNHFEVTQTAGAKYVATAVALPSSKQDSKPSSAKKSRRRSGPPRVRRGQEVASTKTAVTTAPFSLSRQKKQPPPQPQPPQQKQQPSLGSETANEPVRKDSISRGTHASIGGSRSGSARSSSNSVAGHTNRSVAAAFSERTDNGGSDDDVDDDPFDFRPPTSDFSLGAGLSLPFPNSFVDSAQARRQKSNEVATHAQENPDTIVNENSGEVNGYAPGSPDFFPATTPACLLLSRGPSGNNDATQDAHTSSDTQAGFPRHNCAHSDPTNTSSNVATLQNPISPFAETELTMKFAESLAQAINTNLEEHGLSNRDALMNTTVVDDLTMPWLSNPNDVDMLIQAVRPASSKHRPLDPDHNNFELFSPQRRHQHPHRLRPLPHEHEQRLGPEDHQHEATTPRAVTVEGRPRQADRRAPSVPHAATASDRATASDDASSEPTKKKPKRGEMAGPQEGCTSVSNPTSSLETTSTTIRSAPQGSETPSRSDRGRMKSPRKKRRPMRRVANQRDDFLFVDMRHLATHQAAPLSISASVNGPPGSGEMDNNVTDVTAPAQQAASRALLSTSLTESQVTRDESFEQNGGHDTANERADGASQKENQQKKDANSAAESAVQPKHRNTQQSAAPKEATTPKMTDKDIEKLLEHVHGPGTT